MSAGLPGTAAPPPGIGSGITVLGGAGGVRACTEELAALAAALARASRALEAAALAQARLAARLGPPAAVALAPVSGAGGLAALDRDVARLARSVRTAAAIYAGAEDDATLGLRRISVWLGNAWGEAGPRGWLAALGGVTLMGLGLIGARAARWTPTPVGAVAGALASPLVSGRPDALGAVGRALAGPGVLPRLPAPDRHAGEVLSVGAGAFVRAAMPGRQAPVDTSPQPGARVLVGLADRVLPDRALAVRPVRMRVDEPPRDEADLLALVDDTYPNTSGVPGAVAVQRLDHADGSRSWVVAVPGTQDWGLGGPNPADTLSDLQSTAGVPDDATRTAVRAMDLAGIRPGEPVLVVGHSLGGMVATELAADPGVRERFRIAAVLTAGSPVAAAALPDATQALHLEHAQDVVPGLAGLPNPDTPGRTTVVHDLRVGAAPGAVISTVDAHDLPGYEATARLLPADDPSIRAFRRASAEVLGGDPVRATTWTFQGVRVAEPAVSSSSAPRGPGR